MADVENQTASAAAGAASATAPLSHAKKEKKPKNPRAKPSHPPTAEMVTNAIKGLKERGGSSLQAIKKFIAANYKVDAEKVAPFIKKYLKSSVASGSLVQTKGKGASGSFKLASSTSAGAKAATGEKKKSSSSSTGKSKKTSGKRSAAASGVEKGVSAKVTKKPSSPKAKRAAAEKKSVAAAKAKKAAAAVAEKKAAAGAKAASKPKSPSKAKKSNKAGPTKKPKAPKPKTTKAVSSTAKAKKAASPKRKKWASVLGRTPTTVTNQADVVVVVAIFKSWSDRMYRRRGTHKWPFSGPQNDSWTNRNDFANQSIHKSTEVPILKCQNNACVPSLTSRCDETPSITFDINLMKPQ